MLNLLIIDIISVTEYENEIKVIVENLNKGMSMNVIFPFEIGKNTKDRQTCGV